MLKNSKIKIVSIVPRLQAQLVSVMPSYSIPKLVNVKANSIGHGIKPTFTRTSTAYKSDGSVVSAGVPRVEEGKGVLVEEGTVNLLPSSCCETVTVSSYSSPTKADLSLDSSMKYQGVASAKLVLTCTGEVYSWLPNCPVTAGQTYTFTCYTKESNPNSTLSLTLSWRNSGGAVVSPVSGATVQASTTWRRINLTGVAPATATSVYPYINIDSNLVVGDIQWIDAPQVEQKPYATSFHPTIRTAESLTVPANALSAAEGTIEFDVVPNKDSVNNNCFLQINHYYVKGSLTLWHYGATLRLYVKGAWSESWTNFIISSLSLQKGVKSRIAVVISQQSVSLYVNGVIVENQSTVQPLLPMGGAIHLFDAGDDQAPTNAYFSNLRISSIARSDSELANTGALTVDEFTTYYAELTSDLTAHQKGNGNAVLKSIAC